MNQYQDPICYLCGQPIPCEELDDDHVPPKQLYSKEIRRSTNLDNLLTLPTHKKCNRSFSLDEEYFVHTFAPLAIGSESGNSLWNEIANKYSAGRKIPLRMRALNEFQDRPSGLYLPNGKVIKKFDGQRIWRVVWKITRGLFYYHHSKILPEDANRGFDLVSPDYDPPEHFSYIRNTPSHGVFPKVFDYKFISYSKPGDYHFWAMHLWERISLLIYFHGPDCDCEQCIQRSKMPPG